ncbi:Dabb family protein [Lichenihabitans psoromatis]|uniref:Dabb family protein n=1 Tax=Lichenihabitans psoromatis TaxID=2528642 RepID=UPI001035CA18|nr:Dabb family protein [Lichenihabitans psoromatis]
MLRHIVFAHLRADVPAHEISGILAELAALQQVIPGLLAFSAGPNESPEGLSRDYTHAFTVDFTDAAARDAYLVHPAHQAAGARLVSAVKDGPAGLAVVDFTVD